MFKRLNCGCVVFRFGRELAGREFVIEDCRAMEPGLLPSDCARKAEKNGEPLADAETAAILMRLYTHCRHAERFHAIQNALREPTA